jgi:hypothetical protein
MLQFAPGMKVYLALKPVDMRRGFDGLAADVKRAMFGRAGIELLRARMLPLQ